MALAPIDFPNDPEYGYSFEASNGITYTWLGNRWRTNVGSVDINVNPEDITLNTLADVSVANPTSDDIVYWNNQNSLWEAKQLSEWLPNQTNIVYSDQNTNITGEFNFVTDPLLDLTQLHDVTVTDPQIGDTIKWSGDAGGWVNGPACENSDGSGKGGITEAPVDGKIYGRKDANWTVVPEPDDGTAPTPSLADVCAVGSSTGTGITVNGQLNVGDNGVVTGIGSFGIASQGDIGCNGILSAGGDIAGGADIECIGNLAGATLNITGKATMASIACAGEIKGAFETKILADGAIQSLKTYAVNPGGKEMMMNGSGFMGVKPTFRRSTATNITPVDTSNFIAVLKAVNLNRADLTVSDGVRPEIGLFVEDIQPTAAASILTHVDNSTVEFSSTNYEHFLFGVCQKQQELIESLTTRIEQLEVNHVDY